MTPRSCWGCTECIYDEDDVYRCESCTEPFHMACLSSDDGEDGRLCMDCGDSCKICHMIVMRDTASSNHVHTDVKPEDE